MDYTKVRDFVIIGATIFIIVGTLCSPNAMRERRDKKFNEMMEESNRQYLIEYNATKKHHYSLITHLKSLIDQK
jgi:large-conductance mechanosensitive channel